MVTLLILSTNKHDKNCHIIVHMQHTIRLCKLMWDNVSLVNPVQLVKFVKVFHEDRSSWLDNTKGVIWKS